MKDETLLISAMPGAPGAAANDASQRAAVSGDGRYVAFSSWASNLAAGDSDRVHDVFVRDVQGGTTALVSRASGAAGAKANGASMPPDISADGRYVVFGSTATNLDPGDGDVTPDIYVRDLQLGITTLVSRAGDETKANDESRAPSISGDGRYVSFESQATNLDPADTDATFDVFVRDLVAGTTQLVSRASGPTGDAGNDESLLARISSDGQRVTFASTSSNLDPADADTTRDIFVRDLQTASTALVSRATGVSGAAGNGYSDTPDISGDGRYVTFASASSNLDDADVDTVFDVYVRDLADATTFLVSRANGGAGAKGSSASGVPRISSGGWWVVFSSSADNLDPADGDAVEDVFARDLLSGTTWLVSRATGYLGAKGDQSSGIPEVSDDGRQIAFLSMATNLEPPDDVTADVFVRDMQVASTTMVSRASGTAGVKDRSSSASVSGDGRFVAFESAASRLDPADGDTMHDVFVHDARTHALTLVSRATGEAGAKGRGHSYRAGISGDGRYVVFTSDAAALDPDDADTKPDVFVRDMQTATTTLVSRASGAAGEKADDFSFGGAISADGRYVVFESIASNLPGGGVRAQVYVRDRQTSTTTLVSRIAGEPGVAGDGPSGTASISRDGRFVAFISYATNLDPADADPAPDVYVRDLVADATSLVSRASGATGARANAPSYFARVADGGDHVVFASSASNLDDRDGDPREDVFVRDLRTATTTLISDAAGADGDSSRPSISADGTFVAFDSTAASLHPGDADGHTDIFVRDTRTGATTLASRASGASGAKGDEHSLAPALSADGRYVAFESFASNLDPRDGDTVSDIYLRDVLGPPSTDPAAPPPPAPPAPPPAPAPPPHSAAAPSNLVAPSIKGRAILGRRLSCVRGSWTGAAPMRFQVRWVRGGRVVRRNARYRVGATDVGRRLACRVTASNAAGSASAASRAVVGRDELVPITTAGTLRVEVGEVRSRVCRGAVFLTLLRGDRLLARHTLALDGRCRWTWTFKVGRTRLGNAREVLVKVRFAGNALRFPVVYTQVEKVPRR